MYPRHNDKANERKIQKQQTIVNTHTHTYNYVTPVVSLKSLRNRCGTTTLQLK